MRRALTACSFALATLATLSPAPAQAPDPADDAPMEISPDEDAPPRVRWRVLGVTDGDTLRVEIPDLPLGLDHLRWSVRVNGVDTPEKGWRAQCDAEAERGEAATTLSTELVFEAGDVVELTDIKWGKYAGRVVADVWIGDELLSSRLIEAGLARPYDGGARGSWCEVEALPEAF